MTESIASVTATAHRRSTVLWLISIASLVTAIVAVVIAARTVRRTSHEIVVADSKGRPRVRLTATLEGGAIELLDEKGAPKFALEQSDQGVLTLSMRRKGDPEQRPAVRLDVTSSTSNLQLHSSGVDGRGDATVVLDTLNGGSVGAVGKGRRGAFLSADDNNVGLDLRTDKDRFEIGLGEKGLHFLGEGPCHIAHDGLEQEIVWSARHKRLDPQKYPDEALPARQ